MENSIFSIFSWDKRLVHNDKMRPLSENLGLYLGTIAVFRNKGEFNVVSQQCKF